MHFSIYSLNIYINYVLRISNWLYVFRPHVVAVVYVSLAGCAKGGGRKKRKRKRGREKKGRKKRRL